MQDNFQLPQRILVATNNSGKLVEITDLLKKINIEAVAAPKDIAEPEETGATFAENSLLKAKYYANKTGLVALADDSGLCIEALNNEPGIHSARFALDKSGKKNFFQAFEKIFNSLKDKGLEPSGARAHFICNLTIFDPESEFSASFEGRVDGKLTFPARGAQGFGYDPIFIKDGMTEGFGELSPNEKDQVSHRNEAFTRFLEYFTL